MRSLQTQGFNPSVPGALGGYTIALLGFSLFCLIPGLRTFGTERLVYLHREAPAGLSPSGYTLGRILWDSTLGLWLYPAIFGGFYYMLTTFKVGLGCIHIVELLKTHFYV